MYEKRNKFGRIKRGTIADKISLGHVLFWEMSLKIPEELSPLLYDSSARADM
jgi:hypothetical protein